MHWFKPDCVSRDSPFVQELTAVCPSACFSTSPLLLSAVWKLSLYLWFCIWRKTQQPVYQMSIKCLTQEAYCYELLTTSPHFTITWVLLGVSSFLRAHSFAKESFANIWIIKCWLHHNMLTLLKCWICINTKNIVMNRTAVQWLYLMAVWLFETLANSL